MEENKNISNKNICKFCYKMYETNYSKCINCINGETVDENWDLCIRCNRKSIHPNERKWKSICNYCWTCIRIG